MLISFSNGKESRKAVLRGEVNTHPYCCTIFVWRWSEDHTSSLELYPHVVWSTTRPLISFTLHYTYSVRSIGANSTWILYSIIFTGDTNHPANKLRYRYIERRWNIAYWGMNVSIHDIQLRTWLESAAKYRQLIISRTDAPLKDSQDVHSIVWQIIRYINGIIANFQHTMKVLSNIGLYAPIKLDMNMTIVGKDTCVIMQICHISISRESVNEHS
jgi:hypothetical protein